MDPLLDVAIRHQIYLEGLKGGRNAEFIKTLVELDRTIKHQLQFVEFASLGDMSRTAIYGLVASLKKAARTIFDVWLNSLIRWLEDYISVDVDFWKFAYNIVQRDAKFEEADPSKIYGAAIKLPMAANGVLALSFLSGFATLAAEKIAQQTLAAYSNSESPAELQSRLVGSKDASFKDGLLQQLNRQGSAVTNTVIQHLAAQGNAGVASLVWPEYLWVSVLDSRTTQICIGRDGNVYKYGKGPLPPAHINCRSSVVPATGTKPFDMPTFNMWANAQPDAFLQDAFDGKVGASYEGSKPLTLNQFKAKRALILT